MPTEINIPVKCLNCDAELATPFVCTGCRTLHPPPPSANYFDLLGVPQQYEIDDVRLQHAFKAVARTIHPDRFVDRGEEMRELATRMSADVNKAMEVLCDPFKRASYLLELSGGPSAAEVRDVPGGLLAEVMMLREEVEEAQAEHDSAALSRLREAVRAKHDDTLCRVAVYADTLATCSADDKTEFRKLLNSIKYFENLLDLLAVDPLSRDVRPT